MDKVVGEREWKFNSEDGLHRESKDYLLDSYLVRSSCEILFRNGNLEKDLDLLIG